MIMIIGGAYEHRRILEKILQRGPVPVCSCEGTTDVDELSSDASEPISLIFYNADVVVESDLEFVRNLRAGQYGAIRPGVPILFVFRTMSTSHMEEAYALDVITVEKPSEAADLLSGANDIRLRIARSQPTLH